MARKKQPCKNHPQRLTVRRCYYCHEHICHECQVKLEHHLFCGRWCYFRWKLNELLKLKARIFLRPVHLLLGTVLLVNVFLFFYFNHKIERLALKPASTPLTKQSDSLWFHIDSTFSPLQGKTSFTIQVSSGTGASLWHNGKLIDFKSEQHNQIVFPAVPLFFWNNKIVIWAHQQDGTTRLIDSLSIFYRSARLEFLARPLSYVPIQSKQLALTFDAGSTNRGTDELLEVLRSRQLKCTIFVTGRFLEHFPQTVQQLLADGHEIANHTYSHPHLTTYVQNHQHQTQKSVNREFVQNQLLKTDSLFFTLSGRHLAPFWRAPFGEYNPQILRWAAEAGFKHVGWSAGCDALDWVEDTTQTLYRSGKQILQHFLQLEQKRGLKGKIILMHLGTDRQQDFPYLILPALIDSLHKRGYRFVTISQLMNQRSLP